MPPELVETLRQHVDMPGHIASIFGSELPAQVRGIQSELAPPVAIQSEAVIRRQQTLDLGQRVIFPSTERRVALEHQQHRVAVRASEAPFADPRRQAWSGLNPDQAARLIEGLFELPRPSSVHGYLGRAPELVPVLLEAHRRICDSFDSPAGVALELYENPEDVRDRKLFVLIRTTQGVEEARRSLEQLDTAWWLDAARIYGDRMNIDVEFV